MIGTKKSSYSNFQEGKETERLKTALCSGSGPRLRECYAAENPSAPTSKTPRLFYMSATASAGQRFEVS